MTKPETEKLPKLPDPEWRSKTDNSRAPVGLYTADQIRAYALAAVRAQGGGEVKPDGFDVHQINGCDDIEELRSWAHCMRRERDRWRQQALDNVDTTPAPAPDAWSVMWFTGSFKRGSERWEIYSPDGSGGAVEADDVQDATVREFLDAHARSAGGEG